MLHQATADELGKESAMSRRATTPRIKPTGTTTTVVGNEGKFGDSSIDADVFAENPQAQQRLWSDSVEVV